MTSARTTALFQKAVDDFINGLPDKRKDEFRGTTYQDLQVAVARLQDEQARVRERSALTRIQPFLEAFHRYAGVVDVFAQSTPLMPFIWGPVRFLLQLSSRWLPAREKLLNALYKVGKDLPFIDKNASYLTNPRFEQIVVDIYADILNLLKLAMRIVGSSRLERLGNVLWPPFDSQLRELLDKFHNDSDYLDKALREEQFDAILDLRNKTRQNLSVTLHNQKLVYLQIIENSLQRPRDFHLQLERGKLLRRRCPATGSWVSKDPLFAMWLDRSNNLRLLRLCGIPGAGKTTLCSIMREDITKVTGPTNACIISIFCAWDDEKSTCLDVLSSILYQLIQNNPYSHESIIQQYSAGDFNKLYSTKNLVSAIDTLLVSSPPAYIIIDGIDEMQENERKELLDHTQQLLRLSDNFKILISSRMESDISSMLSGVPIINITTKTNAGDIKNYLIQKETVHDLQRAIDVDLPIVRGFLEMLADKVDGMFLYAKVVLDILKTQTSNLRQMRQVIETHPDAIDGLKAAYYRIIERIDGLHINQRKPARRILKLLLAANVPLRVEEIKYAVALDDGLSYVDEESRLRRTLEFYCGPIVEVNCGTVRLVHDTAREYLLQHREKLLGLSSLKAERLCARLTARYLLCRQFHPGVAEEPNLESMIKNGDYVFLNYSFQNWFRHAIRSQSTTSSVKALCERVLIPDDHEVPLDLYRDLIAEDGFNTNKDPSALRNIVVAVINRMRAMEASTTFCELSTHYGPCLFKCSKPSCKMFLEGFVDRKSRDNHESLHSKTFTCDVDGCGHLVTSDAMLKRHKALSHPDTYSSSGVSDSRTPDLLVASALPQRSPFQSKSIEKRLLLDAIESHDSRTVDNFFNETINFMETRPKGSATTKLRECRQIFSDALNWAIELDSVTMVTHILSWRSIQVEPTLSRNRMLTNDSIDYYILDSNAVASQIEKGAIGTIVALWKGLTDDQKERSHFNARDHRLYLDRDLPYTIFRLGNSQLFSSILHRKDVLAALSATFESKDLRTTVIILRHASRMDPPLNILTMSPRWAMSLNGSFKNSAILAQAIRIYHREGDYKSKVFVLNMIQRSGKEPVTRTDADEMEMASAAWEFYSPAVDRALKAASRNMDALQTKSITEDYELPLKSSQGQDLLRYCIQEQMQMSNPNSAEKSELLVALLDSLITLTNPGPLEFHPLFIAPDIPTIQLILDRGASINVCDPFDNNAFSRQVTRFGMDGAANGSFLARQGAEINHRNRKGFNALDAVIFGRIMMTGVFQSYEPRWWEVVQVLIGLGVDSPILDGNDNSAIDLEKINSFKVQFENKFGISWHEAKLRWRSVPRERYLAIEDRAELQRDPFKWRNTAHTAEAATSSPDKNLRPLNVQDALAYMNQVQAEYRTQPDIYNRILDVMKDFKSQLVDTPGVIERITKLFSDRPNLVLGFNTFLPPGYRIECPTDPSGITTATVPPEPAKLSDSNNGISFLQKC